MFCGDWRLNQLESVNLSTRIHPIDDDNDILTIDDWVLSASAFHPMVVGSSTGQAWLFYRLLMQLSNDMSLIDDIDYLEIRQLQSYSIIARPMQTL